MRRITQITAGALASVLLLASCAMADGTSQSSAATSQQTIQTVQSTQEASAASEVDWDRLPTTDVTLTDEGLAITDAGTYVLTGTSTGQVSVDSDGYVRIILDGATITSSAGAAIQIDNAELAVIELADDSTNTVTDAATRTDEEIDGAIYSSDDLIVTINVTSVDDGIRGKDSLSIADGIITIDAAGDGMKSSNDSDLGQGQLTITGGDITISSGDDAIKAEQAVNIAGGTISVDSSVEGIEAPVIVIDDGEITVNASDDGVNASASTIITDGLGVTINGGSLTIVMGSGDTDAIDSNGDLTINGGTIDITAQSPFDFDGTGSLNGGEITVNGELVTELTNQFMGGGPGQGGPGARRP